MRVPSIGPPCKNIPTFDMPFRIIPGYEKIADIDQTKKEFQIDGRTFHQPKFGTANGRAKFFSHPIPELLGSGKTLRLMTVRSEGQFNTVVYRRGYLPWPRNSRYHSHEQQ